MHAQDKEPDYWRVRVTADADADTDELLLVLNLPANIVNPLEATIRCASPAEYASMLRLHGESHLSITGHQSAVGGKKTATLQMDSVRILRSGSVSHGAEHKEWESSIHADHTTIRRPRENSGSGERYSLLFVTDNHWLVPPPFETPNNDGSIDAPDVYPDQRAQFELEGFGTPAEFVHVYSWRNAGSELTRTRRLAVKIPEIDVGENQQIRDQVYDEVDDLLLLVGLATATYSMCVGFEAEGITASTISYRRDRPIGLDTERQSNANETIVNAGELSDFWLPVYRTFCASDFKDEIRTCLHTIRGTVGAYLEPSFLVKFAVLELLMSRHRDLRDLNRVLDESAWKPLKQSLGRSISGQAAIDKASRKCLHANLSQMNRLPLRAVFDDFVRQYEVDLEGVWPMFGSGNTGLANVRNLMVHGARTTKDDRFLPALSVADAHLQWTLEIILLALLRWPRSSTNRHQKALGVVFPGAADPERIASLQDDVAHLARTAV